MTNKLINKALTVLTLLTIAFVIVYGFVIVTNEIKPFWLDEWSIIYNLKFRPAADLWGILDYMQQFPRTYLQIINVFAGQFDYSYTALRLPGYFVHVLALIGCYRLSLSIFKGKVLQGCFWVLAYASFKTSLQYFVQVKQYTMEMALALAAFWQLKELLELSEGKPRPVISYIFLCLTFIVLPFFSYTYPITMAPVYLVIGRKIFVQDKGKKHGKVILPLACGVISVITFYLIEVRNVMQDSGMQDYWNEYMSASSFPLRIYQLFANIGAGDLFEMIYGSLGIIAFIYATYCVFTRRTKTLSPYVLYSLVLVWLTVLLFFAGKLPLGTHRLNAYALPACAMLILFLLNELSEWKKKIATGITILTCILCLALAGNVVASLLDDIGNEKHNKKLRIYNQTAHIINLAMSSKQVIAVTPAVAHPYQDMVTGGWVLKTHPAYKVASAIPVYDIAANENADNFMRKLPANINGVLYFNADTCYTITRR